MALKKNMRACYQCEHIGSDERCKVAGVLECYYDPTDTGVVLAERPKMRMFKQRKTVAVLFDSFIEKLEEDKQCVSCGAVVGADTIICPKCAKVHDEQMFPKV